MAARARRYDREFLEESRVTSDTMLRAVFISDAVAISGDVIALAALGLNQTTGFSLYQGVAAVLIGLVMVRITLRLIQRSHDFLVGAWVLTPSALQSGDGGASLVPSVLPMRSESEPFFSASLASPAFANSSSPSSVQADLGRGPD